MRRLHFFRAFLIVIVSCSIMVLFTPGPCHAAKKKILVVFSGLDYISLKEGKTHQTGFFLSELAVPLKALTVAGYQIECASPDGTKAAVDRSSDNRQFFKSDEEYKEARRLIDNPYICSPEKLSTYGEADLKEFAGIFLPGGHAPMEDLYRHKKLGYILRYFHKNNKPTALICHAPVALLSAKQGEEWIYRDYVMTAFSDQEEQEAEKAGSLGGHVQFYISDLLAAAGARMSFAPGLWESHVVRDRELITGQNPASAEEFAKVFIEALKERMK
jgi:putative intracellular protease/amidase